MNNNAFSFGEMFQKNAFNELFQNNLDFNQLFATQRRNLEALAAANQSFVESAQAISRRQAEVARDNVEQALRASKDMMSGNSPESNLSKQADFTREMFESNLANMRELVEMVTKSGFEAFDVLNQRAAESLEEFSSVTAKPKSTKSAK